MHRRRIEVTSTTCQRLNQRGTSGSQLSSARLNDTRQSTEGGDELCAKTNCLRACGRLPVARSLSFLEVVVTYPNLQSAASIKRRARESIKVKSVTSSTNTESSVPPEDQSR